MSDPNRQDQNKQAGLGLDPVVVARVAMLARLAPDQSEQEALRQELGQILAYFQRLENLDTTGVEPAYHPHRLENRLREDIIVQPTERSDLLATAKKQKDGCLLVPRTVE